jgi:hypothetical protein
MAETIINRDGWRQPRTGYGAAQLPQEIVKGRQGHPQGAIERMTEASPQLVASARGALRQLDSW